MRLVALPLVALLAPGCFAPAATQEGAPELPSEEWVAALPEPLYDAFVWELARFEGAQGASLSAMVFRPDGLPADARAPTLLRLTPYQADGLGYGRSSFQETPLYWGAQRAVEMGAVFVEVALRGTGGSEGCIDFGGALDRADAVAAVAWIRAQPWSNGVVVTDGISHDGMASIAAHVAVPDLAASIAHAASLSYYLDEWYMGARLDRPYNGPVYSAIEAVPSLFTEPESALAAGTSAACGPSTMAPFAQADGRHGPYWDERDNARFAAEARAPLLLTHGFVDANVLPNSAQSYWDALPDDYPKWVVFGWFEHTHPNMTTHPAEDFANMHKRWLERALFDRDNGAWDEPRVLVEDNTGLWHVGDAWPLDGSDVVRLHAAEGGSLSATAAEESAVTYVANRDANRPDWSDGHVAFRSEPMLETRLVTGAPTVRLVASSDQTETKWVLYLFDEAPDGSRLRMTHAYADSHAFAGEDEWRELTPGKPETWDVPLLPTAWALPAGHRLVLLVASHDSILHDAVTTAARDPTADSGWCWPSPRDVAYCQTGILPSPTHGRATNTVHLGPEGTTLTLSWIDPAATRKPA